MSRECCHAGLTNDNWFFPLRRHTFYHIIFTLFPHSHSSVLVLPGEKKRNMLGVQLMWLLVV